VRVLPYGTDYGEQVRDVELVNYSMLPSGGSVNEQVDFYLRERAGLYAGPFAAPPGVVFVQDVPDAAKRMFDKGAQELRDKKQKEGFDSLRRAIELFPTYYAALERLGTEYIMVTEATPAHYEAARILLMKATEVNGRGFASAFGLGLAQFRLKMFNEAVDNFKRATTLHNQSVDAHMYLGQALNQVGKTAEAEASLKRARELGKGKAAEVHFQLARLYSGQNRYSEAADELELYLKNRPGVPDADKMKQTIQQLREKAAKK
jgi:tetratricopeptide (TPR) repeat protein